MAPPVSAITTAVIGRPANDDRYDTIGGARSHGTTVRARMPQTPPAAATTTKTAVSSTGTPGMRGKSSPVAAPVR